MNELQLQRGQDLGSLGTLQNNSSYYESVPYQGYQLQGNCGCGILGCQCHYHYHSSTQREIRDFEILIEATGKDTTALSYGAALRLAIADPIRGHDLRAALATLQTALKELKNKD